MTKGEFITDYCKNMRMETVFRYDLKLNEWYLHIYSTKRSLRHIDIECRAESLDQAINDVVDMITDIRKHKSIFVNGTKRLIKQS